MQDYEKAAYASLEKLKQKHDQEIRELKEAMMLSHPVKYNFSKDLMDLRAMEKKMFSLKEYEKAENYKRQADRMEKDERAVAEEAVMIKIEKEEGKLRQKQ